MLTVKDVSKSYPHDGMFRKQKHRVLHEISFEWNRGECLGIIGESGSGKSTLGRLLLGMEKPDSGKIAFDGIPVANRVARRGAISAVFQDYTSSINPYYTVRKAILEPLKHTGKAGESFDIGRLLRQVGLNESYLAKYPHELSGGEAQRVCIARAVCSEPQCILFDEAVSSLDGSVQMQVLAMLKRLKADYDMGYIFITHDIQAAVYLCDRILIIRNGEMAELCETAELKHVRSPYARELMRKVIS
ncbi:ABC transporter ATP-binding protein [Paenibacillus sp. NEAU-GSW1]|uniref:ABC transporter ATP-binding protein n=1 Tax=Paenibacillus sp. NEAU-GSW1 TaxID=2682486 RepID=UPI0012E12711|nr:ABC transporter ATP-binding protein [Paenibacillus sp. NEAU-GSW1]MUT64405.1 ATP-binding cassette domain-containing protein [Paenibacillus sp. NEAU-GSW1]